MTWGAWALPPALRPGLPFALLLLGAVLAGVVLVAAAARLALAGAGGVWLGLGVTGLRCLLVPTRADLGAHALSYLVGAIFVASGGWMAAVFARQLLDTRRLATSVASRRAAPAPRVLVRAAQRLNLSGRVDLVATAAPFAFCYGLLRPRICVSTGLLTLLSVAELEAVLWHERYHLHQRDPLKVVVGRALATALFFLPVVAELLQRYELARELAADRQVVQAMRRTRPLARAIYRLLTAGRHATDTSPGWAVGVTGAAASSAACAAAAGRRVPAPLRCPAEGWNTIYVRIDHLLDSPPPRRPLVSVRAATASAAAPLAAALAALGSTRSTAAAVLVEAHLIPGLC